jgi:hypothetical protein
MKKLFLFITLLFVSVFAFCQDPTVPPSTWGDVLSNPAQWVASFGGVSFLTAFIAAFFTGLLKITKPILKQVTAWVVAIVILVGSDLFNIGYAKDFPILLAVIHGFAAGLASNGVFDIPVLKGILDMIHGWFEPKPEAPLINEVKK